MKQIKIKYKNPQMPRLKKITKGDWIDLYTSETVQIKKGELVYIPLGVAMELPKGYEAIVAPRSSTPKHFGIMCANSIGVIDESYCGDNDYWAFPAIAIRDTVVPAYSRIAQFRIVKHQPALRLIAALNLGNADRGGFGSTGK